MLTRSIQVPCQGLRIGNGNVLLQKCLELLDLATYLFCYSVMKSGDISAAALTAAHLASRYAKAKFVHSLSITVV